MDELDEDCQVIIRNTSPEFEDSTCEYTIAAWRRSTCRLIEVQSKTTVQSCCGNGECGAAGIERLSSKARNKHLTTPANGKRDRMPSAASVAETKPADSIEASAVGPRSDGKCGKWQPEPGRESFLTITDTVQNLGMTQMHQSKVKITALRTSSWSSTVHLGLTFADVVGMDWSFRWRSLLVRRASLTIRSLRTCREMSDSHPRCDAQSVSAIAMNQLPI